MRHFCHWTIIMNEKWGGSVKEPAVACLKCCTVPVFHCRYRENREKWESLCIWRCSPMQCDITFWKQHARYVPTNRYAQHYVTEGCNLQSECTVLEHPVAVSNNWIVCSHKTSQHKCTDFLFYTKLCTHSYTYCQLLTYGVNHQTVWTRKHFCL